MRVQPTPFTANGVLTTSLSGQQEMVCGMSFKGFTSVTVYNGQDNTGEVVLFASAPGVWSCEWELFCENGVYVEVVGSGKGTVWLA